MASHSPGTTKDFHSTACLISQKQTSLVGIHICPWMVYWWNTGLNVLVSSHIDTSQGWLSWICNLIVIFLVYICTLITFPISGWFVLKVRWTEWMSLTQPVHLLVVHAVNKLWPTLSIDGAQLPEDSSFPSGSSVSSKRSWYCACAAPHWPVAESRPAHPCFQHPALPGKLLFNLGSPLQLGCSGSGAGTSQLEIHFIERPLFRTDRQLTVIKTAETLR